MKTALVADWLPTYAGAEHVLAEFCAIWPDAPLFTTLANHGQLGPLDQADICTTGVQRWYKLFRDHRPLLPWLPSAIEKIDMRGYDLIVSSSHAVGKGVIPPAAAAHLCYCHTPMRYAWEMEDEYLKDFGVPRLLQYPIRRQLERLRKWDLASAKRVDRFVANSRTVAERIERIYGRESTVLHPPVEDRFFRQPLAAAPGDRPYFLAIGRLVPYKRFDLLITVANQLRLPLKIAGKGPDWNRLKTMAGPTVELLGYVAEEELPGLYARAKALLAPQLEDAGVVLLEAQACGSPVVALRAGGALDTVQEGVSGRFFEAQTSESLAQVLREFDPAAFDPAAIRNHAQAFHADTFRQRMYEIAQETYREFSR